VKRLLTVEDTFAITGRGLLVAPMPAIHELRGPGDVDVELRLPDGSRRAASLTLSRELVHPSPAVHRWACLFASLGKPDVPIGTEIWCADDVFAPGVTRLRMV